MSGPAERTALASVFAHAHKRCTEAVEAVLTAANRQPGLHFSRPVTLALALLAEYGERARFDDQDLRLLGDAGADAAAACRAQPADPPVIDACRAFADVAEICERTLGGAPPTQSSQPPWRRFLFADADVEVARVQSRWRVRVAGRETEQKLLDEALAEFLQLSNARLGELTVQVLDWTTRAGAT